MLFIVKIERTAAAAQPHQPMITKEYHVVEPTRQRVTMKEERGPFAQRTVPRVCHPLAPIEHAEKARGPA